MCGAMAVVGAYCVMAGNNIVDEGATQLATHGLPNLTALTEFNLQSPCCCAAVLRQVWMCGMKGGGVVGWVAWVWCVSGYGTCGAHHHGSGWCCGARDGVGMDGGGRKSVA